jgi:hypothetical protein
MRMSVFHVFTSLPLLNSIVLGFRLNRTTAYITIAEMTLFVQTNPPRYPISPTDGPDRKPNTNGVTKNETSNAIKAINPEESLGR